MKLNYNAALVIMFAIGCISFAFEKWTNREQLGQPLVGYSDTTWTVGDTLHVVTAKGDTVRLDVSKLK